MASDPRAYLASCKKRITARLSEILAGKQAELGSRYSDAPEVFSRLYEYCAAGKMIRGTLACLGRELFSAGIPDSSNRNDAATDPDPATIDLAVALELFQAGLLIHDDIMDRDETRRGQPTLHRAYAQAFSISDPSSSASAANAVGEAVGICVGDICYFLATEILADISSQSSALCGAELLRVCFGQIRDVRSGASQDKPSADEVIEIYRNKTARYTFALPLAAGAILSGRKDVLPALESFGEAAGIAFQIRDDALGLFGDSAEIGKPVGSDIREAKKTLHHVLLRAAVTQEEDLRLSGIYGNPDLEARDIEYVRSLIRHYAIDTQCDRIAEQKSADARGVLESLEKSPRPPRPESLELLNGFLVYATRRAL